MMSASLLISLGSLVLFFILYLISYSTWNRRYVDFKRRCGDAFTGALTLNSGLVLFLYLFGKAFEIPFLQVIDDYSLLASILFAAIMLSAQGIDDLRKRIDYADISDNKAQYTVVIQRNDSHQEKKK